jgi:arsenical pump membrane protein
MDGTLPVSLIFLFSIAGMLYLILRKPSFTLHFSSRTIRIDSYFMGALIAPILIAGFGLLSPEQILQGLRGSGGLNPFGVLVLFLAMVFMSIYLDATGFFEFCARLALRYANNNGIRLFLAFYAVISILTIFTSNDIIILTFTPFIYYFTKNAGIDPLPYLIAEFFAANTWSIMLYIGNPTNIVLASAFHLDFVTYFEWMVLPTLAAGLVNLGILFLLFRKRISKPFTPMDDRSPRDAITDRAGAMLGVGVLFGCIFFLAIAPALELEMWMVAFAFGAALFVILLARDAVALSRRQERFMVPLTVKRMPFEIIPFVLAMFISVEALRSYAVTSMVGDAFNVVIQQSSTACVLVYGFASAGLANLVNNIPMTVAFAPVIQSATPGLQLPAIYATVIGSNLGANLTPIGALAGIMWMSLLREKGVRVSFKEFVKYGLLVTPLCLLVCLGFLSLEFFL